jgi:hypothetical protein
MGVAQADLGWPNHPHGPRGWFGHPMGKPSNVFARFWPLGWLNHPLGPHGWFGHPQGLKRNNFSFFCCPGRGGGPPPWLKWGWRWPIE